MADAVKPDYWNGAFDGGARYYRRRLYPPHLSRHHCRKRRAGTGDRYCRFVSPDHLQGNSDTLLSNPFLRPAVRSAQSSPSTEVLCNCVELQIGSPINGIMRAAVDWNRYFMLIRSGSAQGDAYTITANTADTLTLDLQGDTSGGLQTGDSVAIVPYWTLGHLFPGGTGAHVTTDPFNRLTEVLFPSLNGTGINLSASATYYFRQGAWRQAGQGGAVKNDEVIIPDMYLIVRHQIVTTTTVTTEGAVLAGRFSFVRPPKCRIETGQFLSIPRPMAVSFDDSAW